MSKIVRVFYKLSARNAREVVEMICYTYTMADQVKELIIEDLKEGKGQAVKDGDTVVMHYTGWLEDPSGSGQPGAKFDSSYDRNMPFETKIGIGYVIKGWDMGVPGMKVGGKRKLTIPHHLGYGKYGVDPIIPGFATLIFEVELLKIDSHK